jgi:putative endonuclease
LSDTSAFWVYIAENASGRFYVGSTDDPDRRISEHNEPGHGRTTYAHTHGPWRLVWTERHPTRSAAMRREREINSKKSARWIRENLLNGRVPTRFVEGSSPSRAVYTGVTFHKSTPPELT